MHVIRACRPADTPWVEECFVELQDFLHGLEPNVLPGNAAKKYLDFMFARCAETSGQVFVAEVENRVVGFICLWGKVPSEALDQKPAEYAFISDLVVLSAYRGQGLGRTLLEHAEAYARRQGATALELEVLPNNRALNLYRRHGFRDYHILLTKSLE